MNTLRIGTSYKIAATRSEYLRQIKIRMRVDKDFEDDMRVNRPSLYSQAKNLTINDKV